MKLFLSGVIVLFAAFAVEQVFIPRHLPNVLVYCLCAYLIAKTKNAL